MEFLVLVFIIAGVICGYIYYKKVDAPKKNMPRRKASEERVIIDDLLERDKEVDEGD